MTLFQSNIAKNKQYPIYYFANAPKLGIIN